MEGKGHLPQGWCQAPPQTHPYPQRLALLTGFQKESVLIAHEEMGLGGRKEPRQTPGFLTFPPRPHFYPALITKSFSLVKTPIYWISSEVPRKKCHSTFKGSSENQAPSSPGQAGALVDT